MDEKTFWELVEKGKACWKWKGKPNNAGYGRVFIAEKLEYAHRYAYLALVGDIQPGERLFNTCNDRLCVNPEHWTTDKPIHNDNSIVKRKKTPKRRYGRRREKVTLAQVQAMREAYTSGTVTQAAIATRYRLSQAQVSRILAELSR